MKANFNNIAKLKEEAETFSKNMKELGALLKEMKEKYTSLEERITKLEEIYND